MNLILFEEGELDKPLSLDDARARHILTILRRSPGEPFDVGIVDGPQGKGYILERDERSLKLGYELSIPSRGLHPVRLLLGLSRPLTMRRVLRDCTSLGVRRIDVAVTERSEPSYAASSLWTAGRYRADLIDGAQQSFSTCVPEVRLFSTLAAALTPENRSRGDCRLIALDNYEGSLSLGSYLHRSAQAPGDGRAPADRRAAAGARESRPESAAVCEAAVAAVGGERGWTNHERDLLREAGFTLVHLGRRVQRTEVACIAAVEMILSELGFLDETIESGTPQARSPQGGASHSS